MEYDDDMAAGAGRQGCGHSVRACRAEEMGGGRDRRAGIHASTMQKTRGPSSVAAPAVAIRATATAVIAAIAAPGAFLALIELPAHVHSILWHVRQRGHPGCCAPGLAWSH